MIFGDLEQVGRLTKSCIRKFHYRPKRSFGQGYIFTGVCDSVHGGGCLLQFFGGVSAPIFRGEGICSNFSGGGCLLQFFGGGGVCSNFSGGLQFSKYGQRSAGTHPTGMHSCDHIISTHHPLHWASPHCYGLCLYMEMFTLFTMITKLTCKQVRSKKDERKLSQNVSCCCCVFHFFLFTAVFGIIFFK